MYCWGGRGMCRSTQCLQRPEDGIIWGPGLLAFDSSACEWALATCVLHSFPFLPAFVGWLWYGWSAVGPSCYGWVCGQCCMYVLAAVTVLWLIRVMFWTRKAPALSVSDADGLNVCGLILFIVWGCEKDGTSLWPMRIQGANLCPGAVGFAHSRIWPV